MTNKRLVALISGQLSGKQTEKEAEELANWANENSVHKFFLSQIGSEEALESEIKLWMNADPAEGYEKWRSYLQTPRRIRILKISSWTAAACLLIAVVLIGLNQDQKSKGRSIIPLPEAGRPVMPGRNTAILTLTDGRQIALDQASNGHLAIQGKTRLIKTDSGSLAYIVGDAVKTDAMTYNTLTTPRSGQYQLRLPDGSRVWMNNVSSLRYPTAFQGKKRIVELSGEAYFEIAKDADKPFIVKLKNENVEVLGTSFNIMAYPEEEAVQTTLLTGSVRITAGNASIQLKPDEQTLLDKNGSLSLLRNIPSQEIVSWKDGFFYFGRAASFANVMRQLARWYDVDVVYEAKVPDMEFGGKIDRTLPLNELLKFLDKNQVHFRLEDRKLIVLPY